MKVGNRVQLTEKALRILKANPNASVGTIIKIEDHSTGHHIMTVVPSLTVNPNGRIHDDWVERIVHKLSFKSIY